MMDGLFALWHSVTKRGSTLEYFVGFFFLLCRVFVFRGSLFVFGWSLWSFRLYLGASLCTYAFFSSYLVFAGIFLLGGALCLIGTLFVSCFKLLIDLYL